MAEDIDAEEEVAEELPIEEAVRPLPFSFSGSEPEVEREFIAREIDLPVACLTCVDTTWLPTFRAAISQLKAIMKRLNEVEDYRPPAHCIFAPFALPLNKVRVAWFGQDPYREVGVADGLSFSSSTTANCQPSLSILYDELERTVGYKVQRKPGLQHWRDQGVLLLNYAITLVPDRPVYRGLWLGFHAFVLKSLSVMEKIVYVMLGGEAHDMSQYLPEGAVRIKVPHPSPRNKYGFIGCNVFADIDKEVGQPAIVWAERFAKKT